MRLAGGSITLAFVAALICGMAMLATGGAMAQPEAMTGTVAGAHIQKVGFRAMIEKQAIMYNVAGSARNNADGTVAITLQGDEHRIDNILEAIRAGTRRSSTNNAIASAAAPVDPGLKTFTVFQWTSTSRNITTPYDLIFHLRPVDDEISKKKAEAVWNAIAEGVLKGDDLKKFRNHLNGDD